MNPQTGSHTDTYTHTDAAFSMLDIMFKIFRWWVTQTQYRFSGGDSFFAVLCKPYINRFMATWRHHGLGFYKYFEISWELLCDEIFPLYQMFCNENLLSWNICKYNGYIRQRFWAICVLVIIRCLSIIKLYRLNVVVGRVVIHIKAHTVAL